MNVKQINAEPRVSILAKLIKPATPRDVDIHQWNIYMKYTSYAYMLIS